MSGLTRAESQARTRQLIIQAATRLFLREGFQTTSLEQIGEDAALKSLAGLGVSRSIHIEPSI